MRRASREREAPSRRRLTLPRSFVFFIPFAELPAYSVDLGFSADFSGTIVALLGAGSLVGRLGLGFAGDFVGRYRLFHWCIVISGVLMAIWPSCTTSGSILTFSFLYPFFAGGFVTSFSIVAANQWGLRRVPAAMSGISIVSIPGSLAGSTIVAAVYDDTGSYNAAIYAAAGIIFLTSLVMFTVRERVEAPEHGGHPVPNGAVAARAEPPEPRPVTPLASNGGARPSLDRGAASDAQVSQS